MFNHFAWSQIIIRFILEFQWLSYQQNNHISDSNAGTNVKKTPVAIFLDISMG